MALLITPGFQLDVIELLDALKLYHEDTNG